MALFKACFYCAHAIRKFSEIIVMEIIRKSIRSLIGSNSSVYRLAAKSIDCWQVVKRGHWDLAYIESLCAIRQPRVFEHQI